MPQKKELQKLLEELVHAIHSSVNEGLANGTLQPQYEPYFRWKLREYEYGDTGITKKSAEGKEFLKPYWGRAARDISQRVSKLGAYNDILSAVSADYEMKAPQINYYLPTLTTRIARDVLEGKSKIPADSVKYILSLLRDLNGESQEYKTEVHLKGLILQPRSIQLDDNVRLRRPNRSDFEREIPLSSAPFVVRQLEDPTAFLYTRIYARQESALDLAAAMALQNEIDREVAVLRLFRVGAVQDMQRSTSTDSIIHMAGGTQTRIQSPGSDKYLIAREDVKPLKAYWANMKEVELPSSVYIGNQKQPDELSIAYDRYGDSLEAHILEKRISSAVMGLEALYLSPSEQQEMSYRLRMRVSKLLSLIGYNPNEVRNRLIDAYEIRSTHVHGGILKQKGRQKYERKYGDLNDFSKIIMDYLRASIVALLKRPNKTSLINKIDDSFLDSAQEEEIRKLLFMPYEKEVS